MADNITYKDVLNTPMLFATALKLLPTKGNLVYEYNPFHNYRLSEISYIYNDMLYTPYGLFVELGCTSPYVYTKDGLEISLEITDDTSALEFFLLFDNWEKFTEVTGIAIPMDKEDPILGEVGDLVDFDTDELLFDINHPVMMEPLYSYDNSVNLIINDGKNIPRLINSRFSATLRNQYQIVDRKGNNDTNIYDLGSQFDIDTSLYKRVIEIPVLTLTEIGVGGCLPVGNYFFYFRYTDADGNETDFVAESGLVSIFIGSLPTISRTGFREEDSHKLVRFLLKNIDSAYQYVLAYYTRSTSDVDQNATTAAYRIEQKYIVNSENNCDITITGYETMTLVTTEDINPAYLLASSIEALALCQNILFIGNIVKPDVPYEDLADCALRFLPRITKKDYACELSSTYAVETTSMGYFDPEYIYSNVGYWNHEYYRFGVVFILADGTLTRVFNTRGAEQISDDNQWSYIPFMTDNEGQTTRNYIAIDEESFLIVRDSDEYSGSSELSFSDKGLENSKGVISINMPVDGDLKFLVYGINFDVDKEIIDYLKSKYNIKGFFIVRQKRIPTILALAYTIGIDKYSNTPVLPVLSLQSRSYNTLLDFVTECFLDTDKQLTHLVDNRIYLLKTPSIVRTQGAICPEYDVDAPYFNQLFTGDEFSIVDSDMLPQHNYLTRNDRHFYIRQNEYVPNTDIGRYDVRIVGVWDDVKLMGIDDDLFAGRAGEAEEAFRFEYVEQENKVEDAVNLLRGSYGPYLGMVGYSYAGKMVDIKIPGFNLISEKDLFTIRYNDKNAFYAVSDRVDLKNIDTWLDYRTEHREFTDETKDVTVYSFTKDLHRGDCYICQFTHRLNRNFQDPSAPINDDIIDPKCWDDHYTLDDDGTLDYEEFENVNLGDVNAVKLGLWVTFTVRSTKNLNIRSIDDSYVDETAMTGHARGYYPYYSMIADGPYKTPEALCYNKGFERSVSERYNFEMADVPAIKNDFSNRIAYSDIHINDAFKNGFRVFLASHYTDYSKEYGAVIKLVEFGNNLVCVFEHAVGVIAVNQRALSAELLSGEVYVASSKVILKDVLIFSDVYGSLWRDSVIKTSTAIYGVDTVARKIWKVTTQGMEIISDTHISEFLNNNISLTERELEPIIGVRNVKTHYNKFKEDVMFTFYDNLYGFEERVWNLCYNETLGLWITFYSWVPSYSENIYNQYFSFDRSTSKWIAKIGISHHDNAFADGVTLADNTIDEAACNNGGWKALLYLDNRTLPEGDGVVSVITYELVRDNYLNFKDFSIKTEYYDDSAEKDYSNIKALYLCFNGNYDDITSEFYQRDDNGKIAKDERGRRIWLDQELLKNPDKIVRLLNIRAHIYTAYEGLDYKELGDAYCEGFINTTFVDAGYYESVIAVIPEYNMLFLTTDFWKHGQAGIIDIADTINPTYWYGKQHPFEFEFIVNDKINAHKIFDNLQIISNNAEPESFHYEIVGDCFSFANDKKNMYIRQEATKELYQYNGFDVTYDHDYTELEQQLRPSGIDGVYDRSTLMPLYYSRLDTINEIEDYYHLKDNVDTKDFANRSGAEVVKYHNLDEYRLWEHAKAVDIRDEGRLRGNMNYQEDIWRVLINPLNIVQRNEPKWPNGLVPVEIGQSPLPDDILQKGLIDVPDGFYSPDDKEDEGRHIVNWNWGDNQVDEVKLKDKWIKIRVRYKGDKLAIIHSIITLYSISSS